jgi:hypothetical protein
VAFELRREATPALVFKGQSAPASARPAAFHVHIEPPKGRDGAVDSPDWCSGKEPLHNGSDPQRCGDGSFGRATPFLHGGRRGIRGGGKLRGQCGGGRRHVGEVRLRFMRRRIGNPSSFVIVRILHRMGPTGHTGGVLGLCGRAILGDGSDDTISQPGGRGRALAGSPEGSMCGVLRGR